MMISMFPMQLVKVELCGEVQGLKLTRGWQALWKEVYFGEYCFLALRFHCR